MPAEARANIRAAGGEISQEWRGIPYAAVKGISDADAAALRGVKGVTRVTRDVIVRWIPEFIDAEVVQLSEPVTESHNPANAVFFSAFQWNMRRVQGDAAWAAGFEARPDVLVVILDTGINPAHIDMAGRVDPELSQSFLSSSRCDGTPHGTPPRTFPNELGSSDDFNFHGTHVAGIVTTNGIGTAGVAPHARLVAVKVLDCLGSGSFADVISGILYAASIRAAVINMSLGALIPDSLTDRLAFLEPLSAAIQVARDAGGFVVAAAGNNGLNLDARDVLFVPAQSGGVAAISATGPINQVNFDRLASYSNFGSGVISVVAPGGDFVGPPFNVADLILSPCSRSTVLIAACRAGDRWLFVAGTSQASPHVAGAAALVASNFGSALNGDQIRSIIEDAADPVGNSATHGHGRLNVFRALQLTP